MDGRLRAAAGLQTDPLDTSAGPALRSVNGILYENETVRHYNQLVVTSEQRSAYLVNSENLVHPVHLHSACLNRKSQHETKWTRV
jgi:hypothetical protein